MYVRHPMLSSTVQTVKQQALSSRHVRSIEEKHSRGSSCAHGRGRSSDSIS